MSNINLNDAYEELLHDYCEKYNEEEDFNEKRYSDYLDSLSDEELINLYKETFNIEDEE